MAGIKVKAGTESLSSETDSDSSGRDFDSDYKGVQKVSNNNHQNNTDLANKNVMMVTSGVNEVIMRPTTKRTMVKRTMVTVMKMVEKNSWAMPVTVTSLGMAIVPVRSESTLSTVDSE